MLNAENITFKNQRSDQAELPDGDSEGLNPLMPKLRRSKRATRTESPHQEFGTRTFKLKDIKPVAPSKWKRSSSKSAHRPLSKNSGQD